MRPREVSCSRCSTDTQGFLISMARNVFKSLTEAPRSLNFKLKKHPAGQMVTIRTVTLFYDFRGAHMRDSVFSVIN